ncbi:hypothetical protein [Arthrobacter oryzae]|uniref:NACHT domain-containing protein n=1 Tax=Arthrobacter oryzae TaxID=409290 RepID=UPI0030C8D4E8
MEYDLVRMGNKEFEDMTVALCSAAFGPGGQSYGTGRDGGREWTYQGTLPLPTIDVPQTDFDQRLGNNWSGYTVVQVKHKERLPGGAEDRDWLLNSIQKEVNAWLSDDKERKPKPQNFLVITNVRLSAVQEVGGIDKVADAMKKHAKAMNLRGWAVWHSSHVSRLLDNHPAIRQTYLGLVVTGDILTVLLESVSVHNPDAARALTGFVAKELTSNSAIRLTRAGNGPDEEKLAEIGIDLPTQDRSKTADDDGNPIHQFVAANVISYGDHPKSISGADFCTVLIGGPGQGKSTIGQLICQSYRAAILKDRIHMLSPENQGILSETLNHLALIKVPLPRMLRWPIYVRLTEYSEKILGAEDYSLLRFITDQINARGGQYELTRSHLYSWLRQWPWMVVLDGLDEVPDTSTRRTLLEKISEFVTDAAEQNADISILATTRPQGYEDDLGTLSPREYELVELSNAQALHYGRQLVTARHPADTTFADEIYKRLTDAAKEAMTAKLMGSPLQVSIMTSLLEDRLRLPRTRHALFSEFYETIFKREANKVGSVGVHVARHKPNIDAIHNAAGALLQIEGEKSGQADVHLTRSDLKALGIRHLKNEMTYDPHEALTTAERLISIASDRFILLVEPSTDNWGFEVRSFQEFMASRYLVTGPDDLVMARLQLLARSTHWRNTWLFAASQVFDDRSHLREALLHIISEMDESSIAEYWVKPGAVLAGDLLLDNFAIDTPGLRKKLTMQAVELLDSPLLPRHLIDVFHDMAERDPVIREKIQEKFRTAIVADNYRAAAAERTMRQWHRMHKGGIPTFIRSLIPISEREADNAEKAHPGFSIKGATRYSLQELIAPYIQDKALTEKDSTVLKAYLDSSSVTFLRPKESPIVGYIALDRTDAETVSVIDSDPACGALREACYRAPKEKSVLATWLLQHLAQYIGQRVVGQGLGSVGPVPHRADE